MTRWIFSLALNLLLYGGFIATLTHGKVVSVYFASRHGTRAPNPILAQICPGLHPTLKRFEEIGISPAGVTGNGLREMYSVGVFARERYVKEEGLLSEYWDPLQIRMVAAAEDRTLQSGSAFGQGMYGGPPHFENYREPVPIAMNATKGQDNLGEARKGACLARLASDSAKWDEEFGVPYWRKHSEVIKELSDMCGVDLKLSLDYSDGLENMGDAIKDVTDAMMFAIREGFPLQFNMTLFAKARMVALKQLYGRLLGTREQQTYMVGLFPEAMKTHFERAIEKDPLRHAIFGYHGHRELLYALSSFFHFSFNFPQVGFYKHGIPSATTLFFELHDLDETEAKQAGVSGSGHYVRLVVFAPCPAVTTVSKGPAEILCNGQAYRLGFHPDSDFVPYEKFKYHLASRVEETGSWKDLCAFEQLPASTTPHAPARTHTNANVYDPASSSEVLFASFYIAVGVAISALTFMCLSPFINRCRRGGEHRSL